MSKLSPSWLERRSFFSSLKGGAASIAALAAGSAAFAQEKAAPSAHWEPARHDKDNWLDELPGKHRLVFDTTNFEGIGEAILFAGNFMRVNRSDYGLQNDDLAVVIVVRHRSTAFGYNDAIWAKYGSTIAARGKLEDPKSKTAPKVNMFNAGDYGDLLPSGGATLDSLFKQGVQMAVCSSATRAIAGAVAKASDGKSDTNAIYAELTANLLPNSRMVPAGIVAVSRAQERGYTLVKT